MFHSYQALTDSNKEVKTSHLFLKVTNFQGLMTDLWRPRPESNRYTRICSPLHHHSATRPPFERVTFSRAFGQEGYVKKLSKKLKGLILDNQFLNNFSFFGSLFFFKEFNVG
jgi:hypothetical protein